jgi:hypothetical protein
MAKITGVGACSSRARVTALRWRIELWEPKLWDDKNKGA